MAVKHVEHPGLDRLTCNYDVDWWAAHVEFQPDHSIELKLLTHTYGGPEIEVGELLRRGAEYLEWSRTVDDGYRQRIADELLDCYNDNWASDEEKDGPDPLDREGYLGRIALDAIVLDTDGSACWYYSDGDLFAGHWIEVRVGEDREFAGAGLAG
jgi:hypothetical protein